MAAEIVGGAFLSASLQVLFNTLSSKEVTAFIHGKKPINGLLKKLKIMLLSADIVLDDAEEKQLASFAVRQWLDELREATFDAQDLLAEIEIKAQVCDDSESLKSKALRLGASLFDKAVERSLAKMIDRLEAILRQKDVLGLREGVRNRPQDRVSPPDLVEEKGVYGRNDDKEALTKLVLTNDHAGGDNVSVIPVVGMGGIGKTTLAQVVYEDVRVKKHFETRAWVTVSYEFDVTRLVRALIEATGCRDFHVGDSFQVHARLKEGLRGKKFLLVLDDVWNENYARWDALRSLFKGAAEGSKVIVTTRSEAVASTTRNGPIYCLREISDEDSWSLFARHAFGSGAPSPRLEAIGREILRKCKGLPLAVKSLGGLLRNQCNVKRWENVLTSEIWELPREENSILPALWLSYYYLPSHLKRCFAYCSIFPKDHEFKKLDLVLLWMAEDLIQPRRNKTIEEVGEECFDDLLSRSLFQRSGTKPQCFTMHDLVIDLASFVAGGFSSRFGDDKTPAVASRTRHVSYSAKDANNSGKLASLSEAKRLRTFLGVGGQNEKNRELRRGVFDLFDLRCLRVLSLSGWSVSVLPREIGDLKNLRFLNLSWTEVREIPSSVCTLHNLQTLLLSFCRGLSRLPVEMGKLTNLRHLDIQGTDLREMPIQLGQLKDLQTLPGFVLGKKSGFCIRALKELKQLHRGLSISGLENVVDANDAAEANLQDKEHLSNLTLQWEDSQADDSRKEIEILDKLRPHTGLKRLFIDHYRGTKFPNWLGDRSFSSLVSVHLLFCRNCYSIPPLGQLPLLEQLFIGHFDRLLTIGEEFWFLSDGDSLAKPFRSLKRLAFHRMVEWREWSFNGHNHETLTFPVLEKLSLEECSNLTVEFTDRTFPSLTRLSISSCRELESLEGLASNLTSLAISNCEKLLSSCLKRGFQRLESLKQLKIMDHRGSVSSFPPEGTFLPSSLTHLWIINLPNLRALNGEAFRCHGELEEMRINGCSELKRLPEEGLPRSLVYLGINLCRSLSERCERDEGEDWHKIAHVHRVCVNGKSI